LGEIEKMCTHVGIIHKGEIKFEGSIHDLGANFAGCKLEIETQLSDEQLVWVQQNYTRIASKNQNFLEIELSNKEEIPVLVRNFTAQNIPIYSLKNRGGLEEWFLNITKK
jgi:ABC-2 type transport system ATP-binding protein